MILIMIMIMMILIMLYDTADHACDDTDDTGAAAAGDFMTVTFEICSKLVLRYS